MEYFICPNCREELSKKSNCYVCLSCGAGFSIKRGIPLFFQEENSPIKTFYEKNPFPDYDRLDSRQSLIERAKRGIFTQLLDEQISDKAKILEVGCGTGQLSNFLSLNHRRTIFATDICINSLKKGLNFASKNNLNNVHFAQMDLFNPVFKPNSFDVVICNGVLHHTRDPYLGFQSIVKLVKRGGLLIIGLYNPFGRFPTYVRRFIFRLTGNRLLFLDPYLRNNLLGQQKKRAWFLDQYKNPRESRHTVDQILRWFKNGGVEYINSIPKLSIFNRFDLNEKLFEKNSEGSFPTRLLIQLGMCFSSGRTGGLFLMIGRKK